ncbi:MAG TPA: DNA polymerase III subunit beta [Streptosporangiaceae bacterium]
MKFRVEREALGEAVGWVARALPARPVIPVLSGLLVQASGAGLTLSCFDYEVSARVAIPAEVEEAGTALVPGRLLAEIIRSLPPRLVEVSSETDMIRLSCGSAEFELVALPVEEYPGLPEPPAPSGTVDGGVLAAAAAQVVPSASRDDTLPMLTGVCLDIDGPVMTLAATDRYRLAVRTVDWTPARPGLRASALVPARTLADVARTMAPGEPVTIAFSAPAEGGARSRGAAASRSGSAGAASAGPASAGAESQGAESAGPAAEGTAAAGARRAEPRPAEGMISFEGGGRRLTARLIGGDFLRYQQRFPAEFGCRAEIQAEPFMAAVRRVSLVADRTRPVQLTFGPGEVTIEAHTDGRARAAESLQAAFTGSEPTISFNPGYLLDGLAAAAICGAARPQPGGPEGGTAEPEPGRIRLQFTSPAKPALITWAGYEADLQHAAAEREAAERETAEGETDEGETAEGRAAGGAAARTAAGDPPAERAGASGPAAAGDSATAGSAPGFRYLVVPQRSSASPAPGRA